MQDCLLLRHMDITMCMVHLLRDYLPKVPRPRITPLTELVNLTVNDTSRVTTSRKLYTRLRDLLRNSSINLRLVTMLSRLRPTKDRRLSSLGPTDVR